MFFTLVLFTVKTAFQMWRSHILHVGARSLLQILYSCEWLQLSIFLFLSFLIRRACWWLCFICNTFISTEDYGVFHINFNVNRTVLRELYSLCFFELRETWKDPLKGMLLLFRCGVEVLLQPCQWLGYHRRAEWYKTSELKGVCKQAVMACIVENVCSLMCK